MLLYFVITLLSSVVVELAPRPSLICFDAHDQFIGMHTYTATMSADSLHG